MISEAHRQDMFPRKLPADSRELFSGFTHTAITAKPNLQIFQIFTNNKKSDMHFCISLLNLHRIILSVFRSLSRIYLCLLFRMNRSSRLIQASAYRTLHRIFLYSMHRMSKSKNQREQAWAFRSLHRIYLYLQYRMNKSMNLRNFLYCCSGLPSGRVYLD